MDEIEKVKALGALKKNFQLDQGLERDLVSQIVDENIRNNIDRFLGGYEVESIFSSVFSALPWVKLLHGLEQLQFPTLSKKSYQVPDFLMLFADGQKNDHPILVEVKSVNGEKKSLKLMRKQYDFCKAYSSVVNIPLFYAVFWRKWQILTLNSHELFDNESKVPKLGIFDALKFDLASVVGDVYFPITENVYRRSTYNKDLVSDSVSHEKYGTLVSDELSLDNSQYWSIDLLESAVIDGYIKMKIIEKSRNGPLTETIEKNSGPYMFKLTTVIMKHLALAGLDFEEPNNVTSRIVIIELMKKLKIEHKFLAPDVEDETAKKLLSFLV